MQFYDINKDTGEVEIIESSVLMVDEWRELVTYFKNVNFKKLGFYYFKIIILLHSVRSPYNRSYLEEDKVLEKVLRSIARSMLKENVNSSIKPPEIDKKILKTPVFLKAVEVFKELDLDLVHEELKAIEKRYIQYTQKVNDIDLTMENVDGYKNLIMIGKQMSTRMEEISKTLFEQMKTKENSRKGAGKPLSEILKQV